MSGVLRLPLIPVLLAYVAGLLLGNETSPLAAKTLILILLFLLFAWLFLMLIRKARLASPIPLLFFFFLGLFLIHSYLNPRHPPYDISRFTGLDRVAVEGVVGEIPHRSPEGTHLLIRSSEIIFADRHLPVEGLFLLFLKNEDGPFSVGDCLRVLCRLHPPGGFRNPGGFSYERHLAFERVHAVGFLSVRNGWVKIGEGFGNPILLQIERWRDHIRSFLEKEAHPLCSGIFEALVLGEQGNIPEDVKEQFTRTGISHLLAISGDQFGIVAFLSFSLLIWILKRSEFLLLSIPVRKWTAGLTIPWIVFYAYIAGGGMSVIRAAIMVVTFFFSILFDRERDLLHTLAVAAFLILIFSPPSLFDVSFQLSFLAVLSIVYLVPRILKEFKRGEFPLFREASWRTTIWKYFKLSLLVSFVATLGTAPFVVLHFNRISVIGLMVNLFAIPWVGFLIVPLALGASLLSFFSYPLAAFLIEINNLIALVFLKVVAFFASIPFASFFASTPTAFEIILFYSLLFLSVQLRKGRWAKILFIGLCVIFAGDLVFWNLKDRFQKDLIVNFIDVGQGDSSLVEFPGGQKMLIDGGGLYEDRFDTGKQVVAPFLWRKKIRRIDYLVLTHPDPDHLKGLNFIAANFTIGQFWDNGFFSDSEAYLQLETTLLAKKTRWLFMNEENPPQTIHGVRISVFNPPATVFPHFGNRGSSILNNHSLVMKLQFKNVKFLLTGDVEKEAEDRMVRSEYPLKADLLKVPHHGSRSSSTTPFLESVKPTYAILTVGERNIGHLPHPEVLRRYEENGASIFRTDQNGAITVVTDGQKIEVRTFR